MEVENPHSKIITIINEDYVKMLAKQAELKKQELLAAHDTPNNTKDNGQNQKQSLGRKLRNLVKRSGLGTGNSVFIKVSSSNPGPRKRPRSKSSKRETLQTVSETVDANAGPGNANKKQLSDVSTSSDSSGSGSTNFNPKLKESTNTFFGKSTEEIGWWEPPRENLPLDFCRNTSLHGLKYIGQKKRHLTERIFWLVAFIACLILAVVMISDVWHKYNTSPIIVSFQSSETTMDEIPFPAVTICNMNKVLKSKANQIIKNFQNNVQNAYKQLYYLDHVCSATKSFTTRFNFTNAHLQEAKTSKEDGNLTELTQVNEFLREASQNCSDMIPLCSWQDEIYNCSHLFRPIETEFGKCCTFNMVPQSVLYTLRNDDRDDKTDVNEWHKWDLLKHGLLLKDYTNTFPRRQMQAGKSFGLSFLLNPRIDEYYCTTSDSTGFRLATHMPIDTPHVTDFGISIRPKAEIFVNVKPEITVVDPTIFKFDKEIRSCYTFGEFPLKYFKYYTTSNCIDECIANRTIDTCKCKRYYMPRDENQTLCGGEQTNFECAEKVKLNISKSGAKRECKRCYESCNEIDYQSQTTTTPLQKGIWDHKNATIKTWQDDDNLSIVHVFLGTPSTYARIRKELYGTTDLFANTGGLMGLCLGFSGLSLMELVYFITLRAYWVARRKDPNKQIFSDNRITRVWAKLRSLRFRGGQASLEKQAKQQKVDSALRCSTSKLQLSPAYYSTNIQPMLEETVKEVKPTAEVNQSKSNSNETNENEVWEKEKEKNLYNRNRRQPSGVDYKSILGDIV